ncbi:Uncharacterised protein [Klebsiella pneumoniae]|nr:Uncharacterised protein [Klebsiella pneumoniae]VAE50044.1 Uncharacterised protein [Klebsiella aerogenes]SLY50288.1 Uncharacterised protein [Klebsiella pneumoniae]SLY73387.1 Uncharacterised protein [Klebsiella pneumoniae]SLY78149.1 Uncharacterised protein [Klebsiella pneumoniae]
MASDQRIHRMGKMRNIKVFYVKFMVDVGRDRGSTRLSSKPVGALNIRQWERLMTMLRVVHYHPVILRRGSVRDRLLCNTRTQCP